MKRSDNALVPFDFHGDNIEVVRRGDTLWVSVRRVCEALGIDLPPQHRKLRSAHWARVTIFTVRDTIGRNRDAFLCDLDTLAVWLAGIHAAKVAPASRKKLALYQAEAVRVLRASFLGKPSHQDQQQDFDLLVARKRAALALLRDGLDLGLVSDEYVTKYVLNSVAAIDGTQTLNDSEGSGFSWNA